MLMSDIRDIYDLNGNLIYSGDILNSLRHGLGTEYKQGLPFYIGHWKYGQKNGIGIVNINGEETKAYFYNDRLIRLIYDDDNEIYGIADTVYDDNLAYNDAVIYRPKRRRWFSRRR